MLNIGPQEVLLILIVALVVVGPQRLPELARSLARGIREFRKAQDEVRKTVAGVLEEPKPTRTAPKASSSTPAAATPAEPNPVAEVASALRPLAETARELRKAREEVQRSFRVDLARAPGVRPTPAPTASAPDPVTPDAEPVETASESDGADAAGATGVERP